MSLASLLNDAQPQGGQPKPAAVRRVVNRPRLEPEKSAPKVAQVSRPPEIKRENMRDEDILTFCIVSKILLQKDSIERINMCFRKLMEGKLSFPTVSRSITTLTEKYPTVSGQQCQIPRLIEYTNETRRST